MSRRLALVLLPAVIAACAGSDPETIPAEVRATGDAIDSAHLAADIAYLASDALLGRATPSPGLDSASAFVVRRLTQLGLKPGGDSGTFRQYYLVRERHRDTANTWLTIGDKRLREGTDFMIVSFLDSATRTAPLTYVGHGIRVPKKKIDPYAGVTVRDRILIAHAAVFPKGETLESLGAMGIDWEISPLIADNEGSAALLLISPPRLLPVWKRFRARGVGMTSRELSPAPPGAFASPATATVWIAPDVARTMLAPAPGGAANLLSKAATLEFVPSFELPKTTATLHIGTTSVTEIRPHNIIAIVEGRDATLRNEYVMLGAHLDGAVDPTGAPGDTIFNAADDNASGSTALLAIAEAMMRGPRPRRSVIFMWTTGEEVGLWGSRYFAANAKVPLDKIVSYFNVDMIGRSKKTGSAVEGEETLAGPDEIHVAGPRVLSTQLDSLLERTSRDYTGLKLNHTFDRADKDWFYPRTDAAALIEHGVPAVNVLNGEHGDYHGVGDEVAKLDLSRMRRVTQFLYASAWMLAERRERPVMDKPTPATMKHTP